MHLNYFLAKKNSFLPLTFFALSGLGSGVRLEFPHLNVAAVSTEKLGFNTNACGMRSLHGKRTCANTDFKWRRNGGTIKSQSQGFQLLFWYSKIPHCSEQYMSSNYVFVVSRFNLRYTFEPSNVFSRNLGCLKEILLFLLLYCWSLALANQVPHGRLHGRLDDRPGAIAAKVWPTFDGSKACWHTEKTQCQGVDFR